MEKLHKGTPRADVKRQLRSTALEQRIEMVIRELASQSQQVGKPYVYNASQIAKVVPTTRKTLAKHNELITRVLHDLDARRRMVNGDATVEHMREQIHYLKEQIAERDRMIKGLRLHHIDIYKRFLNHSIEAELLIRPIIEKECEDTGKCLFCDTEVDKTAKLKRTFNIIQITDSHT